ncbi:MAG: hypothetical protein JRJ62_16770 [Deltaproteobacteria bacterium]|nr:hypothetical protein [Deltaproteobacteria bacterium]
MKAQQNFVGMTGGEGSTWYKVLAQRPGLYTRYPSIKDGVELKWDDPEFTSHKKRVVHMATILTVVGNPVKCEADLKEAGYSAIATGATEVHVYFDVL